MLLPEEEDQDPKTPVDDRKTWAALTLLLMLWIAFVVVPVYRWLFT